MLKQYKMINSALILSRTLTEEYKNPPIPIVEIAKDLGLEILTTGEDGQRLTDLNSYYTDVNHPIDEQRLDAAGWLLIWISRLHPDLLGFSSELFQEAVDSQDEVIFKLAGLFAAETLLPTHLFERYSEKPTEVLSEIFEVPARAVNLKLEVLASAKDSPGYK